MATQYCAPPYERCRIRPSVYAGVSFVVFLMSLFMVVRGLAIPTNSSSAAAAATPELGIRFSRALRAVAADDVMLGRIADLGASDELVRQIRNCERTYPRSLAERLDGDDFVSHLLPFATDERLMASLGEIEGFPGTLVWGFGIVASKPTVAEGFRARQLSPVHFHANTFLEAVWRSDLGPEMMRQARTMFIIFCSVYLIHLVRIYLSVLIMETDPDWFCEHLRPLGDRVVRRWGRNRPAYDRRARRTLRITEWSLRFLIVAVVTMFAAFRSAHTDGLPLPLSGLLHTHGIPGTYFFPLLVLYALLLAWDVFMAAFVGRPKLMSPRALFLFNDVVGFLAFAALVVIERAPTLLRSGNVIHWMTWLQLAAIVSALVLLLDILLFNRVAYWRFLLSNLRLLRNGVKCDDALCVH